MANVCTFGTLAGAIAFFNIHRTLMGFPREGVHVGGGVHVDMSGSPPTLADPPRGFTLRHRRMRRRLADSVYGWVLDAAFLAAAQDSTARARLTSLQRNALDNALAAAAEDATFDDPELYAEEDPQ